MLRIESQVYQLRQRWPKYNAQVSPLSASYLTAGAMLRQRLRDWTKADHLREADEKLREAQRMERDYQAHVRRELGFLAAEGRDPGPLISGVVSEHFPARVKDDLRRLAHTVTALRHAAAAHYAAAQKRLDTYRAAVRSHEGNPPMARRFRHRRPASSGTGTTWLLIGAAFLLLRRPVPLTMTQRPIQWWWDPDTDQLLNAGEDGTVIPPVGHARPASQYELDTVLGPGVAVAGT